MSFFAKYRLSANKTYIAPTLYGAAFAAICILLLGIAFASTNNAVYFLCFLLSALGIQSLLTTNKNIESLEILRIEVADFFADETGFIRVFLQNPGSEDLHGISLETTPDQQKLLPLLRSKERKELQLLLTTYTAGIHDLPPLKATSDFPFYFTRSWKKYKSMGTFAVFPARRGQPEFSAQAFADTHLKSPNQDEFKNHREYQNSDSPSRIDWKASARTNHLLVKEYDPYTTTKVTLRWEDCPQSSVEEKKSQMSLWIDLAEKKNFEYAVILPEQRLDFDKGPQHHHQCLRALLR